MNQIRLSIRGPHQHPVRPKLFQRSRHPPILAVETILQAPETPSQESRANSSVDPTIRPVPYISGSLSRITRRHSYPVELLAAQRKLAVFISLDICPSKPRT